MKRLLIASVVLLVSGFAALAGGLWMGFPIVGVPANTNCESYGNNGVCNQYTPAGPTNVPSTTLVPADTELANGQNPQTIRIPAGLMGAVAVDAAPLTGASITVAPGTSKLILNPAATIAAATVVLPDATSLIDGQNFSIYSSQTVTALTVTAGTGTTITPSITTVTAAAPIKLTYIAAVAKWQIQ